VARVGLLGGTFNPPHLAHLVCAQEALVQLSLDHVLLVPVGVAPHKQVEAEPGIAHRVAMCEAAVAGDGRFGVSRADAERDGPSYTVELLQALRDGAPGDELRLGVAEREGVRRADISERLAGLAGAERLCFFDMPRLDISSSLIRRRAAAGQPLRYLVPESVAAYIEREGLYRADGPSPRGSRLSLGDTA
jgi:nicotinate-nucleotide adenylyltransferase